uniref:Uncharacterized protein n=1 Tax=Leptobrachium leishanense TaxID=445787 RepID=A0A8C5QUL5_9ANUR
MANQLSQNEILDIMYKVKNKEMSIDEALTLWKQENKPEHEGSKDPPTAQQYNFTVFKHRYRRQKRILQIDFATQMIYNIEKGTLKKTFPFSQVKSYGNADGLRFTVSFYGHHDYELEAFCPEDKENLMKIMTAIIQDNGQTSLVKCFARRHANSDVILEGLLEQKELTSGESWVKCLVKLKREELVIYCTQGKMKPVENTINLSECCVYSSGNRERPSFTIQTNGNSLIFRIPVTEQTRDPVSCLSIRNDWVSLLQEHCSQMPPSPVYESITNTTLLDVKNTENAQTVPQSPGEKAFPNVELQRSPTVGDHSSMDLFRKKTTIQEGTPKQEPNNPVSPVSMGPPAPILPPPVPPLPRMVTTSIEKRTKAFHWDILSQEKINKSVWASQKTDPKKIDIQRLMNQFQSQEFTVSANNSDHNSKNQNILLSKKIAHNFNIVLKSFHMEPTQLKEKLLIIRESEGGLSDEHLTNLRRYVPTMQDIIMYQSYKGSLSDLHIVDQFMLEMCKIPDMSRRLDTLLAIRELPSYMQDLHRLLVQQLKACDQLLKSQAFPAVLRYVLAIGNCLNENAGKDKAKGFRLVSLTKMSQLVSKEKKFTLLHALVEQILLQEPDLAKFSQELTEFEAVPGASVKGLNAEVEVLSKELEKIDQYRKAFKSKNSKGSASEIKFLKDLKVIYENYKAEYVKLSKESTEMKKIYSDILQTFAEAEDQDSRELFGWISTFIKEFQNVLSQVRDLQS